jgi:uncharacterized repeat protein (TIGR03803 family)
MKTRLLLPLLLLPIIAAAQTYTYSTLVSFPAQQGPLNPTTQLIIDGAGNLYGTSQAGGIYAPPFGDGTVFKVSPTGVLTVLHSFNGTDGLSPESILTRDKAGNLYGTTLDGGAYNKGTVYKVAPDGTETVLYNFPGNGPNGNYPTTGLILDSVGDLLGYTSYTDNNFVTNGGSIFKITPQGIFSRLHDFCNLVSVCTNGGGPIDHLIRDNAGNYYGVNCCFGSGVGGTVFKLSPKNKLTVLVAFTPTGGGPYDPISALVQDAAGNLFGLAVGGGNGVYKITPSGAASMLYSFPAGTGLNSFLAIDASGNLYGTTSFGGTNGFGSVYQVSSAGVETDLVSASSTTPLGNSVAVDSAGNLYGTTFSGGVNATGSIFKLTKIAD